MAYNPTYTQPIYQGQTSPYNPYQFTPTLPPPQPQQSSIIWVHGIQAANSFMVAPNSTVALWDIDSQKIYLKSADNSGMTSIKTLSYTADDEEKNESSIPNQYVSYDDLENLENRLADKLGRLRDEIYKFRKNDKKGVTVDG